MRCERSIGWWLEHVKLYRSTFSRHELPYGPTLAVEIVSVGKLSVRWSNVTRSHIYSFNSFQFSIEKDRRKEGERVQIFISVKRNEIRAINLSKFCIRIFFYHLYKKRKKKGKELYVITWNFLGIKNIPVFSTWFVQRLEAKEFEKDVFYRDRDIEIKEKHYRGKISDHTMYE